MLSEIQTILSNFCFNLYYYFASLLDIYMNNFSFFLQLSSILLYRRTLCTGNFDDDVCMYIYIYVYTYLHLYMYLYQYPHLCVDFWMSESKDGSSSFPAFLRWSLYPEKWPLTFQWVSCLHFLPGHEVQRVCKLFLGCLTLI